MAMILLPSPGFKTGKQDQSYPIISRVWIKSQWQLPAAPLSASARGPSPAGISWCCGTFTPQNEGETMVSHGKAWALPPNFPPVLSLGSCGSWTSHGFNQQWSYLLLPLSDEISP
jgi:hypothetical protein